MYLNERWKSWSSTKKRLAILSLFVVPFSIFGLGKAIYFFFLQDFKGAVDWLLYSQLSMLVLASLIIIHKDPSN